MRFRIRYTTRYAYEQPASDSHNELRVCPTNCRDQKRLDFRLQVTPKASISERRDDFGNLMHLVSVGESHNELTIVADSIVDRIELLPERGPHTTFSVYLRDDMARNPTVRSVSTREQVRAVQSQVATILLVGATINRGGPDRLH